MERREKKTVIIRGAGLLSLLVVLSVALAIFFNSAFGWFSSNKKVAVSGMGIRVPDISNLTTVSCYSLHYDGIYGAVCQQISGGTEVTMSEYDNIFLDRNINTPLVFRIIVGGVPDDENSYITVNIPCLKAYADVNGSEANEGTDVTGLTVKRYLSNVVDVKVGCGLMVNGEYTFDNYFLVATTESREPDNVTVFQGVRDAIHHEIYGDKYVSGTFVDAVTNRENGNYSVTFEKRNMVRLRIDFADYADFLYTPAAEDNLFPHDGDYGIPGNCLVLNLVFDYSNALIEIFSDLSAIDDTVTFENDIGTIYIQEGSV